MQASPGLMTTQEEGKRRWVGGREGEGPNKDCHNLHGLACKEASQYDSTHKKAIVCYLSTPKCKQ